jgi:hypothetical protein
MKVFVSENITKSYNAPDDYHWCDGDELLMFGQFTSETGTPSEVSMCGIKSQKFTTHIVVKDIKITKEFYLELLIESVERSMRCVVGENGDYGVTVGFDFQFNIYDIMNELLDKADKFDTGDKIRCYGRILSKR